MGGGEVTLLLAILLTCSGCLPWAIKAECFGGGETKFEAEVYPKVTCGVKGEVTVFSGGR